MRRRHEAPVKWKVRAVGRTKQDACDRANDRGTDCGNSPVAAFGGERDRLALPSWRTVVRKLGLQVPLEVVDACPWRRARAGHWVLRQVCMLIGQPFFAWDAKCVPPRCPHRVCSPGADRGIKGTVRGKASRAKRGVRGPTDLETR